MPKFELKFAVAGTQPPPTGITKQNAVKLLYKHHENIAELRTKQVRLIA